MNAWEAIAFMALAGMIGAAMDRAAAAKRAAEACERKLGRLLDMHIALLDAQRIDPVTLRRDDA